MIKPGRLQSTHLGAGLRRPAGERLAALATFAKVVELNGFSAAAREIGVSKSAVSKQVARLEDDMGARLLNRTTRRLSLTEPGRAFYQGALRVLLEAEEAEQAVTHLSSAPRGILKVSAPMSFGVRHVAPLMPHFMSDFPELSIELDLNDRVVDLVEEGYDLALRIVDMQDSILIARRLAPSKSLLCASPEYLARQGVPKVLKDLTDHECLLYKYQATGDSWRFQGPGGERRIRISSRLRANNGDALLQIALGGLGIVLLPSFICNQDVRAGRLVRVLPEWSVRSGIDINAVYPANRNLSPKVRVFIDFLAARFGPRPYWDEGLEA